MLQELVKEYLSNPDFFFLDKTASEKLQLAQEYNREQKPSLATSCVVARMDIGIALDRVYNEEEAKEIMTAYKNCAKNLSEAKKTETDENKLDEINDTVNELSDTIRNFAGAHKEVAEQVLDIIDEYIGSERDFWTIEICLRHNHDIWERGFSIAHKIVDSEKRKAESRHKEHPELACSANVVALFNVLFDVASEPKNIEKIAKEYAAFENNMNEGWLTDVSLHEVKGARGYLTEMGRREEFDNYPALMKYILRLSMMKKAANVKAKTRGMDDSDVKNYTFIYGPLSKDLDTPFAVIYKEFKEKYKDKLEALQVEDRMKKAKAMLPEAAEQKNIPVVNFNVDLVYAGKERPTLVTFEKIVPLTHDNYNPRLGNNKSKPKSGGLWTSPMEENGKSEWQSFIEREWPERKDEFAKSWHIVPTEDCRILEIDNFDKIKPYLKYDETIDFIKLSKDYDLLYLPMEVGSWNETFYSWDVKTGYFMNAVSKEGKPLFQVFDDKEYTHYRIEQNKKKLATSKGNGAPNTEKTRCRIY